MTQEVAYRFIEALNALEQDGEMDPIVDTFSEFCEIETPVIPNGTARNRPKPAHSGPATERLFDSIHSTFRNIVIGDSSIALEWTANGVNRSGRAISLRWRQYPRHSRTAYHAFPHLLRFPAGTDAGIAPPFY